MSDLARALAFAFRRKGADALPGSELRLLLAYDLRWFAPEDAKLVVQRALETGLLREEEGGVVRAAFDVAAVDVPLNFRPTRDVLDEAPPARLPPARVPAAPAPEPAAAAAPAAPAPARETREDEERLALDERRRRGGLMDVEVARLVVARRAGEDVAERAKALEAKMMGK